MSSWLFSLPSQALFLLYTEKSGYYGKSGIIWCKSNLLSTLYIETYDFRIGMAKVEEP